MKTCPICQRPYADDTMDFCLADGAHLENVSRRLDLDATWRLTPARVDPASIQAAPTAPARSTDEPKPLTTLQYQPGFQVANAQTVTSVPPQSRSVLPWIFAMVVVLAGAGVLIAVILTRSRNSQTVQLPASVPQSTASPTTADKTLVSSSANVNKPKAPTQNAVPAVKSLISGERRKRDTSSTATGKKKVEQTKPFGESVIPIKP